MRAWIRRSFKNRILCTVLLAALLPLLLCDVLMVRAMIVRNEHSLAEQAQAELSRAAERYYGFLDELDGLAKHLADSTAVKSALRRGGGDSKILYQVLYRNTQELRDFAGFGVYGPEGSCLYSTDGRFPAGELDTGWGVLYMAANADGTAFCADDGRVFKGARAITTADGRILGYVVIQVEQSGFDALFADVVDPMNDLMIFDATWRGIYYTQSGRAEETAALLREQFLSGEELSGGNDDCVYTLVRGEREESFILQQPKNYTSAVRQTIRSVSVIMGALGLLLCFWCAWQLSRQLFEPVQKLDSAMRQVERGDYSVELESSAEDELGRLTANFNRMTREYRENLERSVQRERELNETRLSMLQAQLNPHFLYNTLDSIKWMGVTNGVPQVAQMATDLAVLLRAGISGEKLITLERELELIDRYLEIQEIRFADSFTCEIEVEDRFQHCIIPKLVLQPIVENAILHGVGDMEYGYIKISAREDRGDMILTVSDNGKGIAEDVLAMLNSPGHQIPGGHLGLNNVDKIIRLYYGESYGIAVFSQPGEGCRVELRLPFETQYERAAKQEKEAAESAESSDS